MTQTNEQLIETIEKALLESTQGKWLKDPGDHIENPAVVYIIEPNGINTTIVADNLLGVDAELIANAPEWLRATLERLKIKDDVIYTLTGQVTDEVALHAKTIVQLQQTREEHSQLKGYAHRIEERLLNEEKTAAYLRQEIEQVKAERDDYSKIADGYSADIQEAHKKWLLLSTELSAKDKVRPVVQWFAEHMELRLMENDHKSGWDDESREFLLGRLEANYHSLYAKLQGYGSCFDADGTIRKAVNIANFAMMIADNSRSNLPQYRKSEEPR